MRSLSMVVHGESGVGKSWLGDTAPAPRLILDAENGSRFTPSQPKVLWDPVREQPPQGQETVIVQVRDFSTVELVFQWLNSGAHDFKSIVWDSLTEIQKRCLDAIAGVNSPKQQEWGDLLRKMEAKVREFRDLTFHPTRPLEAVIMLATTKFDHGEKRPNVQGQLAITLPQFVDVVAYMQAQHDGSGGLQRSILVAPYPGYVAKDRTDRLGQWVVEPHIERMLEGIYGN